MYACLASLFVILAQATSQCLWHLIMRCVVVPSCGGLSQLQSLSEQQLVDCSKQNNGFYGGLSGYAFDYYKTVNAATESPYPYTARDGTVIRECCLPTLPASMERVHASHWLCGDPPRWICDVVDRHCSLQLPGRDHRFDICLQFQCNCVDRVPASGCVTDVQMFGADIYQRMEKVSLPAGLQSLAFGADIYQRMGKVSLPAGLQSFAFGADIYQRMEKVSLPAIYYRAC